MPIVLSGGVNERDDPTVIGQDKLSVGTGIEYRVGRLGPHVARGRKSTGWQPGTAPSGAYGAQFDSGQNHLLVQDGSTVYLANVQGSMSTEASHSAGSNPDPLTGTHYANRHYLVNGVTNLVLDSSLTFRKMGMAQSTITIGTSVTQGASNMSAAIGLAYWVTEYDSLNGIESIAGTVTSTTDAFTQKDGVVVTLAGSRANSNADTYRVYRTTDGDVFPTGGLLTSLPAGTSTYLDSSFATSTLLTPVYGVLGIGGLDFERDIIPPVMSAIGGPFEDSLMGWAVTDPHTIRFTEAGYPESWPACNTIPVQTERNDIGIGFARLGDFVGAFTRDTVWRISRLPRSADSAFAGGEAASVVTRDRGLISRNGAAAFTIPGGGQMIAFASRDGIFATNLDTVIPLTDEVDWETRVDASQLADSFLINDPTGRRLVFSYSKPGSQTHNGVMYIDYISGAFRITHPDHGALRALAVTSWSGMLRVAGLAESGSVYIESVQDIDDSQFYDTAGSVHAIFQTGDVMIAGGPFDNEDIGNVSYMHDRTDATITHSLYFDGNAFPHTKSAGSELDFRTRSASEIGITRRVNSARFRLDSVGTQSWGLHWYDTEGLHRASTQSVKGL